MIHLFYNKLNQNEVSLLRSMLEMTKYPMWKLYNISSDDLPSLDDNGILNDKIIMVYDITKTKSAFEKTIESVYNIKDIIKAFPNMIRIDRPNTFKVSSRKTMDVWKFIKPLCNIKTQTINKQELPATINKNFNAMIENINKGSRFIFKDQAGKKLEVRPEGVAASLSQSLTYAELLVLVAFRYVMDFDKMEILSE